MIKKSAFFITLLMIISVSLTSCSSIDEIVANEDEPTNINDDNFTNIDDDDFINTDDDDATNTDDDGSTNTDDYLEPKINAFQFLHTKNPSLSEDVSNVEIRSPSLWNSYHGTIVMIVPRGTDFSNLAPKIAYEGSSIMYKNEADSDNEFKEFTPGTFLDFKHPNKVIFRIHNSDNSEYATYRVLVDVKTPIVFDNTTVKIDNGKAVIFGHYIYENVIEFTNYGNYPIPSDLFFSDVNVTQTPEAVIKNYYINSWLTSDGTITTNQKGRLYVTTNFPSTLKGTFTGYTDYKVDVTFKIVNRNFEINKHFDKADGKSYDIYTPAKVEVQASVFVSNE
ncbi:hypothetical protein ABW636_20070 [Aquimarina sp. 2201CG1-2-11]|uniref:hypothetical protein n=1 Tax=Aquimarina discodermiae TaxID=3231043 RepID=UPI003463048B